MTPRCGFPSGLCPGPAGAAFTTDTHGRYHPAPGLQCAFCGGGEGGYWEQEKNVGSGDWVRGMGAVCDRNMGRIQMIEQRVSTPVLAAPGSHQLPQWAHRSALSHHSLFALWGLLGPNLHLHSGEFTFCPLGVTKTSY